MRRGTYLTVTPVLNKRRVQKSSRKNKRPGGTYATLRQLFLASGCARVEADPPSRDVAHGTLDGRNRTHVGTHVSRKSSCYQDIIWS